MAPFSTVGLFGKYDDPSVIPTLQALAEHLQRRGVGVIIDDHTHRRMHGNRYRACRRADIAAQCDLAVVVGGDGTLLDAGRAVAPHGVPLVGINLGRLGFMVDVLPAQMLDTLDEILQGEYVLEERLMLESTVERDDQRLGPFHSVNDVVVRNREFLRILEFDSYLNGGFISHHRADGLIVASPTGSTAYALSGGGPVLQPGLDAMVMVPVCPHTLSDRPIVVDGASEITIRIAQGNDTPAMVTFDGQQNHTLRDSDRVIVRRAEFRLRLMHPRSYDYFNILRSKLHWGRGQRLAQPKAPDPADVGKR